jgi:hypothetical protein
MGNPVAVSATTLSKRSFSRRSSKRCPSNKFSICRSLATRCSDTRRVSKGLLKSIFTTHTPHSITAPGRMRIAKACCFQLLWVVIIRLSCRLVDWHSLKNARPVRGRHWRTWFEWWCCVREPASRGSSGLCEPFQGLAPALRCFLLTLKKVP